MNLSKMIETQSRLNKSIKENKSLENKDLTKDTFVALIVELGEFANEGRWFKFWSENQKPNTDVCDFCDGNKTVYAVNRELNISTPVKDCPVCRGSGKRDVNPLLEEYVDCVHLFLSIAIQKGWERSLYINQEAIMDLEQNGLDGGLTGIYLELMYFLNVSHQGTTQKIFEIPADEYHFSMAWFLFIGMGMVGFGFKEDEIESAYYEKNKINHERQANGY